jgi:dTDP-glucose pyrophosphorylase
VFLNIPIDWLCVSTATPLRGVIEVITRGNKQIALVVGEDRRLLGTITDGDVRRAILRSVPLDAPAGDVMQTSFTAGKQGIGFDEVFRLVRNNKVRHLPLVDEQGVVVDLAWLSDLIEHAGPGIPAVVMAGGEGRRLRPLTDETPKPLLPVGDRPLLEIIVEQLREAGIQRVHLATRYKGDKIAQHFGDGRKFSVDISYLTENLPLGTAGALAMMEPSDQPLLVINGDILTNLDFRAMMAFHEEQQAVMTVAAKEYQVTVPYGVLETDDARVIGLTEKPVTTFFVNAGIYLLSPEAQQSIPTGRSYDMTDLIKKLIAEGKLVISFPVQEYWLDIGNADNYQQAQADKSAGTV